MEVEEHWAHLWEWFWQLSAVRGQGFSGPEPITFSEIASWTALTGEIVRREEVRVLLAMDAAYRGAAAEEQEVARARSQDGGAR